MATEYTSNILNLNDELWVASKLKKDEYIESA